MSPAPPPAETIEAARQALRGARPAVVAHEIWWAYGLELVLPETVLLCVQRSSVIDALRHQGTEVFCLSEHIAPATAAGCSAVDVFEHPAAQDFCRRVSPLLVMATKPTERLAAAVGRARARLVPERRAFAAARRFENKLAFVGIAARAGVPTPPWQVIDPGAKPAYDTLAAQLGPRMVAQGPRGNAGQRTWLVEGKESLNKLWSEHGDGPLRLAGHIEGMPFTASGVAAATREGGACVAWIEPCRQITGVDWLTPMPLGSCGNAWGDPALAGHEKAVAAAVKAIGRELGSNGYDGAFGVDFVLGPGGPVVIETNPRLVASLPLATQLEVAAGRAPLVLHHLIAAAGNAGGARAPLTQALDSHGTPPLQASAQVIVRSRLDDRRPRPDMASGVYRLRPGWPPELLRPGTYLRELTADDEALVLVREPHEPVLAAKEFARVLVRGSVGEGHPGLREAVAALRGSSAEGSQHDAPEERKHHQDHELG